MSPYNVVPSLLSKCLQFYLLQMDSLTDQHLLCAFASMANSTVDHLLQHLFLELKSIASFERVIRFVRLFGHKITQVHLILKICQIEGELELRQVTTNRMVTNLLECLDVNTINRLDIYLDYPLREEMGHFCQSLGALHALQYIRICIADLDDRIIEAISSGCSDLRELNIRGKQFSDKALRMLVPGNEATPKVIVTGCPKLAHLVLYQNRRTAAKITSTCLADLLRQLKALTRIDMVQPILNRAFIALMSSNSTTRLQLTSAEVDFANRPLLQFLQQNADIIRQFARAQGALPLSITECSQRPYDMENIKVDYLRALACLMPGLDKLKITLADISELMPMCSLGQFQLSFLGVTIDIPANLDTELDRFEELQQLETCECGLQRMLTNWNYSLRQLELINVPAVVVDAITKAAPLLEHLEISNVKRLRYSCQASHQPRFATLKRLIICSHSDYLVDLEALLDLLVDCASTLEILTLAWFQELGDEFITTLLARNPLSAVHTVEFQENGDDFTIASIRRLVMSRQSALVLNVSGCSGISHADMAQLATEIREQNRNITLKYHPL